MDFLHVTAYKNLLCWTILMSLHQKFIISGPFWCYDMKSEVFMIKHLKGELHFKICILFQKVWFYLDAYFKTCYAPQKVQFWSKACFKMCCALQKVRFWKNACICSPRTRFCSLWEIYLVDLHEIFSIEGISTWQWVSLHQECDLTCWKLFLRAQS